MIYQNNTVEEGIQTDDIEISSVVNKPKIITTKNEMVLEVCILCNKDILITDEYIKL